MLMAGIVPGWLGRRPAPEEMAEADRVGLKVLMKSAGLLHPCRGHFAVWNWVPKTASPDFHRHAGRGPRAGSGCGWEGA